MLQPILQVENIVKEYKDFTLNNISFNVMPGSVTGFIGINGAGKTTTIRSICGLISNYQGNVIFNGQSSRSIQGNFKNNIGIVLDGGYFYEDLTIKEMKKIVATAYENWDDRAYEGLHKRFKLNYSKKISELSKGTKMKFSLALALSHNAKLLIMDEPTSGLDPLVRSELLDILKEYVKDNTKSVLFSTHITSDLEKIADNIVFINNGNIIFSEAVSELKSNYSFVSGSAELLKDTALTNALLQYKIGKDNTFCGVVNNKKLNSKTPYGLKIQGADIEQIMLAFIDRGDKK